MFEDGGELMMINKTSPIPIYHALPPEREYSDKYIR